MYAAVLRGGITDISEKAVRREAEVYLHSMLKRTKYNALPSIQDASLEHVTGEMSQYLYSVRRTYTISCIVIYIYIHAFNLLLSN